MEGASKRLGTLTYLELSFRRHVKVCGFRCVYPEEFLRAYYYESRLLKPRKYVETLLRDYNILSDMPHTLFDRIKDNEILRMNPYSDKKEISR